MYDDTHQNSEARRTHDTRKTSEFNIECKNLSVLVHARAAPRVDGAAQRVMDGLLRECLKRKSLTP